MVSETKGKKMSTKKRLVVRCCGVVLLAFLFGIFASSRSQEFSIECGIFEKASYANLVEGEYTPVESISVSGTAIFVPFEQYRERFLNSEHTVILEERGDVHYLTKIDSKIYISGKKWPLSFEKLILCEVGITHMDFGSGVATLSYTRNWISTIFLSVLFSALVVAVGSFVCLSI